MTTTSASTVVTGPFYDPKDRTGRGPCWVVVVKTGCMARHSRFHQEADAQAFADAGGVDPERPAPARAAPRPDTDMAGWARMVEQTVAAKASA